MVIVRGFRGVRVRALDFPYTMSIVARSGPVW